MRDITPWPMAKVYGLECRNSSQPAPNKRLPAFLEANERIERDLQVRIWLTVSE